MTVPVSPKRTALLALARERILVLDGAMGTMIQALEYDEAAFRGERFKDFHRDLRGNNDLLILTQPKAIEDIHADYLRAGADIVATNTFSSTSIAQADYDLSGIAYEMNREGAKLARAAAMRVSAEDGKPRFVAGAIGPTNRTASISPDVSSPGFRAVTFDDLRTAYGEQINGLLDGGADLLLLETIFDTLNAKAALYAIAEICEARGIDVPVMISGTITDKSGRLLSGQLPEAFWNSVRHAKPITIGFNCALGAEDLRAHIADIGRVADTLVCAYPNAGLPNEFGAYDESPEFMAGLIGEFAGCRPGQHRRRLLRHHARSYRGDCRRRRAAQAARDSRDRTAAAALRPRAVRTDAGDSLRQCRRAHQRHRLGEIPQADHRGRLHRRVAGGARPGRERRADHRRQHGRGPARFRSRDGDVPQPRRRRAGHRPRARDGRFLEIRRDRSRPEMRSGQAGGELDLDEGRRGKIHPRGHHRAAPWRGRGGDGVRRGRTGRHVRAQDRNLQARLRHPGQPARLPAGRHHLRSQHLRDRDRPRRAQQLRRRFHRGDALDPPEPAACAYLRRRLQPVVLVPRQRAGARGDAFGVPVSCHQGRHGYGHRQCRPDDRL